MTERILYADGFLGGNASEASALIRDLGLSFVGMERIGGDGNPGKKGGDNGRAERTS